MLTEIYIEAFQVWEAWDKGEIDDFAALISWRLMALTKIVD